MGSDILRQKTLMRIPGTETASVNGIHTSGLGKEGGAEHDYN